MKNYHIFACFTASADCTPNVFSGKYKHSGEQVSNLKIPGFWLRFEALEKKILFSGDHILAKSPECGYLPLCYYHPHPNDTEKRGATPGETSSSPSPSSLT
jgi:hypothetical protein